MSFLILSPDFLSLGRHDRGFSRPVPCASAEASAPRSDASLSASLARTSSGELSDEGLMLSSVAEYNWRNQRFRCVAPRQQGRYRYDRS